MFGRTKDGKKSRKIEEIFYDRENQIPVIRASICTGERVAGFKNVHTGKFEEVMLIQDERDLAEFTAKYHIDKSELKKEW